MTTITAKVIGVQEGIAQLQALRELSINNVIPAIINAQAPIEFINGRSINSQFLVAMNLSCTTLLDNASQLEDHDFIEEYITELIRGSY